MLACCSAATHESRRAWALRALVLRVSTCNSRLRIFSRASRSSAVSLAFSSLNADWKRRKENKDHQSSVIDRVEELNTNWIGYTYRICSVIAVRLRARWNWGRYFHRSVNRSGSGRDGCRLRYGSLWWLRSERGDGRRSGCRRRCSCAE